MESLSPLTIPRAKEGILLLNKLRHSLRQKILTCEKSTAASSSAFSFLHNHHLDRNGKGNATTLSLAPTASSSPGVPPRTDGVDQSERMYYFGRSGEERGKGRIRTSSSFPIVQRQHATTPVHFVRSYVRCCWYKRGKTKKSKCFLFKGNHNFAPMGDDVMARDRRIMAQEDICGKGR